MTQKQFMLTRLVAATVLGIVVAQSMVMKNYVLPIVAVTVIFLSLILLKKKVKGVLADERDYALAGNASRWTITIYSLLACLAMFVFFAFRDINPAYEAIGSTLAYSACFLMILNGLIFRYYQTFMASKNKSVYLIIGGIIILLMLLFGMRVLSGEDNWICQNGQWIKHGQPNFPAPSVTCQK